MMINYKALSKIVSHALRHEPEFYSIKLDKEGWVSIDVLIAGLMKKSDLKELREDDIVFMVENSLKKRHEISNGFIRAVYGHSTDIELQYKPSVPPVILYHGTSKEASSIILKEGLKPMSRVYVHLSADKEAAVEVGRRKEKYPVVLQISSLKAHSNGIDFYFTNDMTWLAKSIPPTYIDLNLEDAT